MKKVMTILFIFFQSFCLMAQSSPDCFQLKVEKMYLTGSGYIAVELSNSCTNCWTGIEGCVYGEMKIINRLDNLVIGESNCYCLMTPPNSGVSIYLIPSSSTVLPPVSDIKLYFHCGNVCDDIEISENALSIAEINLKAQFKIYPNPASEKIYLNYTNNTQIQNIFLMDVSGQIIRTFKKEDKILDVSGVSNGVYFLNIQTKEGTISEKIIIQ